MRFLGVSPPDPNLDVTGTYRISGTDITVHLGGKVSKTTLDLSSDPSSRSDIISLLLFGRKASDLNRSQSVELANTVYGYLGAEALRALKERFGQDIPLDLLTIEQGGDTNGSALILGKYVTPRLFVVYRRDGPATTRMRFESNTNYFPEYRWKATSAKVERGRTFSGPWITSGAGFMGSRNGRSDSTGSGSNRPARAENRKKGGKETPASWGFGRSLLEVCFLHCKSPDDLSVRSGEFALTD